MAKKRGEPSSERTATAAAEQAEGARLARLEMVCEAHGPPNPDAGRIAADEAEAALQHKLEYLRTEWQRDGNPLFVWLAMAACHSHARQEAILSAATDEAGALAMMNATPVTPPAWVLRYLGHAANTLRNLTFGRDWREFERILEEGGSSVFESGALRTWRDGSLDPDQAARLIPWALGITRPGFNAFRDFIAHDRAKWLAEDMRRLREEKGLSAEEAADFLAQREGYDDARSVKRIISKARRRMAKPTG